MAPSLPRPIGSLRDPATSEPQLLTGRDSPSQEFFRVVRISREFVRGFRALHREPPCITFFGSARFGPETAHYAPARELAARVASLGFSIMTGGGPGLMDAASRGGKDVGGRTIGATIDINQEPPSDAVDKIVPFHYFFARKVILVKYSYGFVHLPGGFGTLDEMFEALTLIQTKRLYDFPVVLFGREYWNGLISWVGDSLLTQGAIAERDVTRLVVTDDPDEVIACLVKAAAHHQLELTPPPGARH